MSWGPFIYQFVVGGIIFFTGFILCWRSGDHSWKRREDRMTSIFLIVMVAVYFFGQLFWRLYGLGNI